MRDLTETVITCALALAIIITTVYAYGASLTSLITRSFDSVTSATKDVSSR